MQPSLKLLLFLPFFSHLIASVQSMPISLSHRQETPEWQYDQRVKLAEDALSVAVHALTGPNGTLFDGNADFENPYLYAQLAEYDVITQKDNYKSLFHSLFLEANKGLATINVFDYILYGYAAIRAHTAYSDPTFLTLSEQLWNTAKPYVISGNEIKTGKIASKTVGLWGACNEKSLLGGVFKSTNATDGTISPKEVVSFFTLSAHLGESTKNTTYIDAAKDSLQFIRNFLYRPNSNDGNEPWVFGLLNHGCDGKRSYGPWWPITGDFIEGLSILLSITGDEGGEMRKLLQDTIDAATRYRASQRSQDEIIVLSQPFPDLPTGDPFLIRGLSMACRRNHTLLSAYLKHYTDVQYNALIANATFPGTNIYSGSWIGPPIHGLDVRNQTYASMVLVHGIALSNTSTSTPTDPKPTARTPGATSSGGKSTPVGAIVGCVIGGVVVLGIIVVVVLSILRRWWRKEDQEEYVPSPFNIPPSGTSETSDNLSRSTVDTKMPLQEAAIQLTLRPSISSLSTLLPSTTDPGLHTDDLHARFQAMSTAEMVRILNTRIQIETLDSGMPPAYPQSQIGSR